MRHLRIFFLHAQDVFEQRGRAFVWLLITAVVPLILILFWRGAKTLGTWTFQDILSYYLFFIVFAALLMSHHEEVIAKKDIQEGQLTSYILKPYSYFWLKFFEELPLRLLQGGVGLGVLFIIAFFFPQLFTITSSPLIILLTVISSIFAYFIAFLFKAIVGVTAFWMTETRGLFDAVDVTVLIFAGYIMPLVFFPHWLFSIIQYFPFAYMIYYPVLAVQGKLTILELSTILGMQCLWIIVFAFLFQYLWKAGMKEFTAVGQ